MQASCYIIVRKCIFINFFIWWWLWACMVSMTALDIQVSSTQSKGMCPPIWLLVLTLYGRSAYLWRSVPYQTSRQLFSYFLVPPPELGCQRYFLGLSISCETLWHNVLCMFTFCWFNKSECSVTNQFDWPIWELLKKHSLIGCVLLLPLYVTPNMYVLNWLQQCDFCVYSPSV